MSAQAKLELDGDFGRPALRARIKRPDGRTVVLRTMVFEETSEFAYDPACVNAVVRGAGRSLAKAMEALRGTGATVQESPERAFDADFVDIMQAFLDAAWKAGLRPSSVGHVDQVNDAQQQHIDDLRAVAFKALGISEPERVVVKRAE